MDSSFDLTNLEIGQNKDLIPITAQIPPDINIEKPKYIGSYQGYDEKSITDSSTAEQREIKENHINNEKRELSSSDSRSISTPNGNRLRLLSKDYMKTSFLYNEVYKNSRDFIQWREMLFYMATWNVNNKKPPSCGLDEWLRPKTNPIFPPDFYCIAFQEVDLTAGGLISQETSKVDPWKNAIDLALSNIYSPLGISYKCVAQKQLVGIFTVLYVLSTNINKISDLRVSHIGTGLMKKMGNKGGVSISFTVDGTRIILVGAHLNAHTNAVQRRNEDYICLKKKLYQTVRKVCPITGFNIPGTGNIQEKTMKPQDIFSEHDLVLWLGDLNYRIDPSLDYETVVSMIEEGKLDSLLKIDQLNVERTANHAFNGFKEGKITFRPTYKFVPGTVNMYIPNDDKVRIPAWCDRILWNVCDKQKPCDEDIELMNPIGNYNLKPFEVICEDYISHPNYTISDHKPVSCMLHCAIKYVDTEKRKEVINKAIATMDEYANLSIPDCQLSVNEVNFGVLKYNIPMKKSFTISNIGSVTAEWKFVDIDTNEASMKCPWIRSNGYSGKLLPGESVVVELTALINKQMAIIESERDTEVVTDVLVVRIIDGRDFFISVQCIWKRTYLGMSIEELCRMPNPIRGEEDIGNNGKKGGVKGAINFKDPRFSSPNQESEANEKSQMVFPHPPCFLLVPKELWRLIDYAVTTRAYKQLGFLLNEGDKEEMEMIRFSLDTGSPLPPVYFPSMENQKGKQSAELMIKEDNEISRGDKIEIECASNKTLEASDNGRNAISPNDINNQIFESDKKIDPNYNTKNPEDKKSTSGYSRKVSSDSIGASILQLLMCLSSPVLPSMAIRDLSISTSTINILLKKIPRPNCITFIYICSFCKLVLKELGAVEKDPARMMELSSMIGGRLADALTGGVSGVDQKRKTAIVFMLVKGQFI